MSESPRSVPEVTDYIATLLADDAELADLWVEGEVLELFQSRAGHVYFTIGDSEAKLKSVLFRTHALRQRSLPRAGDVCALHGAISVYAKEGAYQYHVDFVRPAGFGLAALEYQLLRQQLESEGLFDKSRKRQIPVFPKTIGVVTSAQGAVLHDIRNVLQRRNPFATVLLSPAAVQGDTAPESLRSALALLVQSGAPDVIILARGGGGVTDLAAFNDERLVRDVFASPIPIVSAVGHETDWTLTDETADLRAPAPSAAAELCSMDLRRKIQEMTTQLEGLRLRELWYLSDVMIGVSQNRDEIADRLTANLDALIRLSGTTRFQLERKASQHLRKFESPMDALTLRLHSAMNAHVHRKSHQALRYRDTLNALNPMAVLNRGFIVVSDRMSGQPVRFARDTQLGQQLDLRFSDGVVSADVNKQ